MFDNISTTSVLGWLLMVVTVIANIIKAMAPEAEGVIDTIIVNLADLKNIIIGIFVNLARMRTLAPGLDGFIGKRR